MVHTLHSEAPVRLISLSQSEEQSNRGVCKPPPGSTPFTVSSKQTRHVHAHKAVQGCIHMRGEKVRVAGGYGTCLLRCVLFKDMLSALNNCPFLKHINVIIN